jgi:hypothetical protein
MALAFDYSVLAKAREHINKNEKSGRPGKDEAMQGLASIAAQLPVGNQDRVRIEALLGGEVEIG